MAKTKVVWKNAKRRHLEAKNYASTAKLSALATHRESSVLSCCQQISRIFRWVYLALGSKLSNTGMKQKVKTGDAFKTYKTMSSFTLFCFCFFLDATIASSKFKKV